MAGDSQAREQIELGNKLFTDKLPLDSLRQELAWQFCPDLAEFTSKLFLGRDWAADRMDGFPEQVSRDLSNAMSAMLRPSDKPWFRTTTLDDKLDADEDNARCLEYVANTIRRSLYDPRSHFVRATKEADRFYVNFGEAVISMEEMRPVDGSSPYLFVRNHHIKDCAWIENEVGDIDYLFRREKMTARAIVRKFSRSGDKVDPKITKAAGKEPYKEFDIFIVVCPSNDYGGYKKQGKASKLPFKICYIDVTHNTTIREGGLPTFPYICPRWVRFASYPYAFSPATMPGLADARMSQMLAEILLEAGEKSVLPPILAKQEVVIGEPDLMAGGISWIDMDHDGTVKDALQTLSIDADMRVGFELRKDVREMLTKSFYLDKLSLPEPNSGDMTAFEVARRWEEHIRNLLPLFEPMQVEYNSKLLDTAYAVLNNMNRFDPAMIPDSLTGANVTWAFESPIERAREAMMVEQFKGSLEVYALGVQSQALTANPLDVDTATRDAIRGVGGPATWRKTMDQMKQEAAQKAQQNMIEQAGHEVSGAAQVAGQVGEGAQKLKDAGLLQLPPPSTLPIDPAANQAAIGQ